ncbi:hypothetical protein R2R35_11875 [Anaerocolumna sp. AGMB13020]|uniref:hypothetical protein n=1 Tax=Anaerocolumna sp. AGMB13020 TaxID=3081750 RepID=UPI0029535FF5|nr:hypothetical protein [Anaerocolumna sp. AGMB13020]WOO34514.1 hypothetical protein R2R35_11875 [Anaerocolumna sp. AGMB13020]
MKIPAEVLLGIWLLLCSFQDIKEKKISVFLIVSGGLLLSVTFLIVGGVPVIDRLSGLLLGLLLLAAGRLLKGQIGDGDGLIICITGICLGFIKNLNLMLLGLSLTGLVSLFLLIFRRAERKDTIPFVPFLFLSYLGVIFLA